MEKLAQDAYNLLGIRLTNRQIAAFERYEQELLDWNARFNLTAIRESEGIRTKHFLDSLTCLLAWRDNPPGSLIDIGTGAGFPGIPLKIIYPSMNLTLVESVGKKAEFCRHIVKELGLERVEVLQARAEALGQQPGRRERYDWAVARAVANLPILAEFLLPFVRVGGAMLAQKGESGPAEAHASENAVKVLGGRLRQLVKVHLPGVAEDRYLVIIDKIAAAPPNYPRRVGVPAKKPL
ncbi:MAG: 16S rRNA (guanine(527)-N(7))-methyltransferase RsmG [Chloroflexi bacterium]|nr:16S rRNA (guanine(527)-N(7))-methyltransferase RsmG [Chloroflexota bacterium]